MIRSGAFYKSKATLFEKLHKYASGLLFGAILLMSFPGIYIRQSIAALACLGLLLLLAIVSMGANKGRSHFESISLRQVSIVVAFIVILLHDFLSGLYAASIREAASLVTPKLLVSIGMLLSAFPNLNKEETLEALIPSSIGFGVYSGVNVVAYRFLGMSGITSGSLDSATSVVMGVSYDRMIAPFSEGLNNFGMYAAIGLCLSLLVLAERRIWKRKIVVAMIISATMFCAIATIMVQMRSAVFIIVFVLLWIIVKASPLRLFLMVLSFGVYTFGPEIYMELFNSGAIDILLPYLPAFLERTGESVMLLSGRVNIWAYAIDQILGGQIPFLGQGTILRDMSAAFSIAGAETGESGMTCHNGFLDLICVYGVFAGIALIAIFQNIFKMSQKLFSANASGSQFALGVIVLLLWSSALESTSASPYFWAMLLIVALQRNVSAQSGLGRHS